MTHPCRRISRLVLFGWFLFIGSLPSRGQAVRLNVRDFGAQGDAVNISVNCARDSSKVECPAYRFAGSDVGRVVELFGAGAATSLTNHQDLLATIVRVDDDHDVVLDRVCGITATGLRGLCGRNDTPAFQACVNACRGTNTVIYIPAGRYLLLSPPALNPVYVMSNMFETLPAVTIQTGGITFMGADAGRSILLGCGAWQLRGAFAYRGYMFACQGPVTNDAPLVFDRLTMDGGAFPGRSSHAYFPASPINGDGWDPTHDAVIDTGAAPYHRLKVFQNCVFRNWRGEMLKSVVSVWDGYVEVTNCLFLDGNATAFNFTFSHTIEHCFMSNLVQAVEFYQGYCSNACYFRDNTVTDMEQALYAVTGALTNRDNRPYNIISNTFYLHGGQNGIQTTPAQNVNILGNQFIGDGLDITLGSAGYQGSDVNSNIVISRNDFVGAATAVMIEGSGQNAVRDVMVAGNRMALTPNSGNRGAAAGYGWSTNVIFRDNTGNSLAYGLNSAQLTGQWYWDDGSNQWPPWVDYGDAATNFVSYIHGRRHSLIARRPGAVFALDDTHPAQVPPHAEVEVEVEAAADGKVPAIIYSSAHMSGDPVRVAPGQKATFYWNGSTWDTLRVRGL